MKTVERRKRSGAARRQLPWLLCAGFFVFFVTSVRASAINYGVTVYTSSLANSPGIIDLQFNPGPGVIQSATVSLTAFTTDATPLANQTTLTGDAYGTFPVTLVLSNSAPYNDIFQGVQFGRRLSFNLAISGAAIDSPSNQGSGSRFGLSIYSADQITPLLTSDPNGTVVTLDLDPRGRLTVLTFTTADGKPPVAVVQPVPEPASPLLFGSGVIALVLCPFARRSGLAARWAGSAAVEVKV